MRCEAIEIVDRNFCATLQPRQRPGFVTPFGPARQMPSRPNVSSPAQVRGVQADAGHIRKDMMSRSHINGDPATMSRHAPVRQSARIFRRRQSSCRMEKIGNRAGTIVSAIDEGGVTASPTVRLANNFVHREHSIANLFRSIWGWRDGACRMVRSAC